MKIVVLGSNGMLGHTVCQNLFEKEYDIIGIARKFYLSDYKVLVDDYNSFEKLSDMILKEGPDVVVNCVGILNEFAERSIYDAIKINTLLPVSISLALNKTSVKFIQISTDCVFSGNEGMYNTNDPKDGTSIYSLSKSLGEVDNNKDLTIRCSIIGPDRNNRGIGLFNWFMNEKNSIKGYKNVLWNGVTSLQLSEFIDFSIKENISGLLQLSSPNVISKHDLLVLINKNFRNESIDIKESYELKSNKTLKPSLDSARYNIPSYDQMVYEMKRWILEHPTVYSHYMDMIKS